MSPFVRPKAIRRGDRMLALGIFLICLAVYTLTCSGLPDNPDAEVEFQTTSAIARTGSLAIGGTPEAEAIIARRFDVMEGRGDRAGRYYSWFGVGQALTGVPFYFAGSLLARAFPDVQERHTQTETYGVGRSEYFQHLAVGWRNPLFGALTVWLFLFVARRLGASRAGSCLAAIGYAFCTFAWPQARSTLSDVQATFFLFLALHLVFRFREGFARGRTIRISELMLFGFAVGFAFLTRVLTGPAVGVLVIAFVFVAARARVREGNGVMVFRELLFGLLPAVACLLTFFYLNHARFGDPMESGYGQAVGLNYFQGYPIHWGLIAQFVSPGRGLFWLAPGAFVGLFGMARAWGRGERLWPILFVALFVCVAVPPAATLSWGGAWTFGPRYILPLLPILWLGVGITWDAAYSRKAHWAPMLIMFAGLIPNLGAVLVDHMTHQELAVRAAEIAWPETEGVDAVTAESQRFDRTLWDWRFAAPWAHWRILRHRISLENEEFGVREIFYLDDDTQITPVTERSRGWSHLAWYDLEHRLHGAAWPVLWFSLGLVLAGLIQLVRSFDSTLS